MGEATCELCSLLDMGLCEHVIGSQGELMLNLLYLPVRELVYAEVSGRAALLSGVCQLWQINGVY